MQELIDANRQMADGLLVISNHMMRVATRIVTAPGFHWWTSTGDVAQELIKGAQNCTAAANSLRTIADRIAKLDGTSQPSTAGGGSRTPGA